MIFFTFGQIFICCFAGGRGAVGLCAGVLQETQTNDVRK